MNQIDALTKQTSQTSELRELRIFACALCILVFIIFTIKLPWLLGYRSSLIYPILINFFILLLTLIKPRILEPLFKFWQSFAKVIGGALAYLALVFIFYLVLSPTAILARYFKHNPLALRSFCKGKQDSFYNFGCQNVAQKDMKNLF
ncbi:MAG: hypothetical protein KBD78_14990 [Oligoflexales bacterium]|nr:hypothetical protein [Oligoflexales bacterium]